MTYSPKMCGGTRAAGTSWPVTIAAAMPRTGMFGRLMELTEGSFHIDVQALLADDDHAVAVVNETASRGGRRAETFGAHIFRMRDGIVVELWESSTDQYAMDEVLG